MNRLDEAEIKHLYDVSLLSKISELRKEFDLKFNDLMTKGFVDAQDYYYNQSVYCLSKSGYYDNLKPGIADVIDRNKKPLKLLS